MSDELKQNLRGSCYLAFEDGTNDYETAPEAANRIEELEGQLKTVLDRETSILRYYDVKLDVAEAKLAKAIEVIDNAATLVEDRHFLYMALSGRDPKNCSSDLSLIAEEIRLASTELKGQDYE